ncbi:hypothetical protein HPULCUR_002350 [Helicostylum pulchrum]|uniref:Uncharacterized protein n=1 Tax=Helicostylum pulchrum TaxID=562976 RepID=A0ABP9XSA7_9FUNG
MMTDVILNRMKLPKRMVLMPFFTILFYMFLTFIIYAIKNVWVYPFLDWNQGPKAAIWYFAIAISVVVIYFFMIGIHLVRNWIAKILDNESDRETIHFQETRSTMV